MRKVEYKEFQYNSKGKIDKDLLLTQSEALFDIDEFEYIMKNGYVLFDKFNNNNQITNNIESIRKYINTISSISVGDLGERLYSSVNTIIDMHTGMNYGSWRTFGNHYFFFYSDIIVKQLGNEYYYLSGCKDIKKNALLKNCKDNLFRIISEDNSLFCIGVLSNYFEEEIVVNFDEREYVIPLSYNNDSNFKFSDYNYDIYSSYYIDSKNMDDILKMNNSEFINIHNNRKSIILDYRYNHGGFPEYIKILSIIYDFEKQYEEELNKIYSNNDFECKQLISPFTTNGMMNFINGLDGENKEILLKRWKFVYDQQKVNPSCYIYYPEISNFSPSFGINGFKGKLIILVNGDSISAGESICGFLNKYFAASNYIVIGENTNGAQISANPIGVYLNYSNIFVGITTAINEEEFDKIKYHGESKGYYPFYWLRNNNELFKYLEIINK